MQNDVGGAGFTVYDFLFSAKNYISYYSTYLKSILYMLHILVVSYFLYSIQHPPVPSIFTHVHFLQSLPAPLPIAFPPPPSFVIAARGHTTYFDFLSIPPLTFVRPFPPLFADGSLTSSHGYRRWLV
ncbi:hypothetical protein BOTBODRAFT_374595 [Botryobasidium botryosum FD-172 SS1]|uniref:Uncharacterized protein n=1 Tax=Botryobasidium botryosum (strain FD-172 SS1) TaxID=930990 RepID=A0A067MNH8_BOTB1|nr:hypothetical protein BOTBODRAFT_374595 [Botryobasidium botryosum FD-172 SS1]